LERACVRGRLQEKAGERLAACDPSLAPDQLFHALLGLHPGPAAFAPSGRGGDREFQAELLRLRDGKTKHLPPLGREIGDALINQAWRIAATAGQCRIEILHASDADLVEPCQVFSDALLAHVTVDPMPPDTRLCGRWWILEARREGVSSLSARNRGYQHCSAC